MSYEIDEEPQSYTRDQLVAKIQWFFDCMSLRRDTCQETMKKFESSVSYDGEGKLIESAAFIFPDKEDYAFARAQDILLSHYIETFYELFENLLTNLDMH